MAIRLRNISYSPLLKILAVLVTVAGALLASFGLLDAESFQYALQTEVFTDSAAEAIMFYDKAQWVRQLTTHDESDSTYKRAVDRLSKPYVFLYYTHKADGEIITNIGPVPEDVEYFFKELPSSTGYIFDGNFLYVGLSEETFQVVSEDFSQKRIKGIAGLYASVSGLLLALFGTAYVLYSAGNTPQSQEISLSLPDRMYLDVGLLVCGGFSALGLAAMLELWGVYREAGSEATLVLGAVLVAFVTLLALQYLSMVTKRLKRGEFLKHTLVYTIISWTLGLFAQLWSRTVKTAMQTGPLAIRVAIVLVAYSAAVILSVLLLISSVFSKNVFLLLFGLGFSATVGVTALIFVTRKAAELKEIVSGVARIKAGDLSCRIPETGSAEFAHLAENINNIASGLAAAVENEVRAERMKAELITNVSHDLKTPLTSIITYIDLLKTEGLSSTNSSKYLDVLDKKSQRLKILTDDLFEAAKAASGNVSLQLETLDAGSLLTQGLGELSERIADSGLDFRVSVPQEKLTVQADGRLLWRAIENVLCNALNYALPGSRVYVEALSKGQETHLVFKNISASPLNMEPEELLERFKRGDESRTSEGSGLGLAIAKSLVELQGGRFRIEIDGDLFKVTMILPRKPEPREGYTSGEPINGKI